MIRNAGSRRVTDWPSNQADIGRSVDLRRPWIASPRTRAADVEEGQSQRSTSTRSTPQSSRKQTTRRQAGDEEANRPTTPAAATAVRAVTRERRHERDGEGEGAEVHMDERPQRREVTPADWRAYGYWARPFLINFGLSVNNATPAENPRELGPAEVDAMLASLRDQGGESHPENWVPRVRHPCLPPRPDLWRTPQQSPEPLPDEIQLNPWLVHRRTGPPPLHFDLRLRAADVLLNGAPYDTGFELWPGMRSDFYCEGPNGSQPATYPGVPRLRVVGILDDPQLEFAWPFTILPRHEALPVLMRDVLDALIANFEERMTQAEVRLLSPERRSMVFRAYTRRTTLLVAGVACPADDGLRRVDYLGDNVCFRGLEPAPDGQGFLLCLGPPP
ncbi:hypothetical protein FKP32DRAFT_1574749 [Trametes sanguinea]|nr:hypothetical protein FKP32DRAFT_1574749 [Trametes sanguinea]